MLTTRPMISATSSSGADTISMISIACRPSVITESGVMSVLFSLFLLAGSIKALRQRADQQLPAVDLHEQHQLERQRHDRRRHYHHALRLLHAVYHHVDDQIRYEDGEADLE